jgi:hypothetical protein
MNEKCPIGKFILGLMFFLLFLFYPLTISAQSDLSVDVNIILNNVENKPIGINVNYLMDDSYLSPSPSVSTGDALKTMGVRFLRYPGGEKSDNYFFDSGTYGTPLSPAFARTGPNEWPAGDSRFASPDFSSPKSLTLDFDEFMSLCSYTGATPLIVVPYDCIYKTATPGGSIPTKEDMLRNAEEWVKYANITRAYGVKYWMIGNESYNTGSYNGWASAVQYRDDIVLFSQRMKAIDPEIKIIINGDNDAWWSVVLPSTSLYIDFLGVSNYPVWNFTGGYNFYKNNSPDLLGSLKTAINGIKKYAQTADKSRLKVISTEFNSMDWSKAWTDVNDLGHALVVFDILGQQLQLPEVEFSCFWNTRWIDNREKQNVIYDALSKDGKLNANGLALSIWGNFLLEKMVSTTGSSKIKLFASYSPSSGKLNVYAINKEIIEQAVNITLKNYSASEKGIKWEFSGTSAEDVSPSFSNSGAVTLISNKIEAILPPTSITVFEINPSAPSDVKELSESDPFLYPNPVINKVLRVQRITSNFDNNSIILYNNIGQQVWTGKIDGADAGTVSLPANIKTGLYFIKFADGKNSSIEKIFIE